MSDALEKVIVRMTPDLHAAIKARAEEEDRTMAHTIRRAIRQYLDRRGVEVTMSWTALVHPT